MVQSKAFRLFRVDVFSGRGRKPLPDTDLLDELELIDYVEDRLTSMVQKTVSIKPASLLHAKHLDPDPPKDGDPSFTLLDYSRSGRIIQAKVSNGRYGDRDSLVAGDGGMTDIRDRATARDYLVRMAFPEGKNIFYMVAEVRGRSEAGVNLLGYMSFLKHLEVCKIEGDDVRDTGPWYRFKACPLIDGKRFDDITNSVNVQKLTLKRSGLLGDGSRDKSKVTVEALLREDSFKQKASRVLFGWIENYSHGHELHGKDSASQVATIFPEGYVRADVDWDDATITFEENDKPTKVSAQTIGQLFTYPMPPGSRTEDIWIEADEKLSIIAQSDGIRIPHISVF